MNDMNDTEKAAAFVFIFGLALLLGGCLLSNTPMAIFGCACWWLSKEMDQ